jgi:hypothetical protein
MARALLLAVLTFIGQPRMSERVEVAWHPAREAIDKARAKRRLGPQIGMKEVWLVIDIPREAEISAYEPAAGQPRRPGGVAPGGMPLHRVRMFWRWRLGKLEVVRPHFRGSVEDGFSRRLPFCSARTRPAGAEASHLSRADARLRRSCSR